MGKRIRKKIDMILTLIIVVILLPLFITIIGQRMQLEEIIYGELQAGDTVWGTEVSDTEEVTQEMIDSEVTEQDLSAVEERIPGIVAKEISMDAPEAAILAQCVIARTNLYDARAHQTEEPEALSIEEMRSLWGEQFEEIYAHLQEYIERTANEVLMYENTYAFAAYHALSAGKTRDMSTLYNEAKMPYLTEVDCEEDAVAEGYLAVSYWEQEEFVAACVEKFPESGITSCEEITIESRDSAGYVNQMRVGNIVCTGEEFRNAFGLNSACLTVTDLGDGQVRIVTKGRGHGFGLSQNTAMEMAEEGKSYQEILTYFFPGTELKQVSDEK